MRPMLATLEGDFLGSFSLGPLTIKTPSISNPISFLLPQIPTINNVPIAPIIPPSGPFVPSWIPGAQTFNNKVVPYLDPFHYLINKTVNAPVNNFLQEHVDAVSAPIMSRPPTGNAEMLPVVTEATVQQAPRSAKSFIAPLAIAAAAYFFIKG